MFLFVIAIAALTTACSSSHAAQTGTGRPSPVHVELKSGCPSSLAGGNTVRNPQLHARKLLPNATPTSGLLCAYDMFGKQLASRPMKATKAASFAAAINGIKLNTSSGKHGCPLDAGLNNIAVFSYAGRPDVDLWWHASGCQWLTNGHDTGSETANPSFYNGFMVAVQKLHP